MTAIRSRSGETAARALEVAEELVQKRGFNDFSYADVAAVLGITTASLHYHFPSKAELGVALIRRYTARFQSSLDSIEQSHPDAGSRLSAFAEIYEQVLRNGRMCLCGMLASDYETLPAAMRKEVVKFFEGTEDWVISVLDTGRREGALKFEGSAESLASMLVAGLEGAMLIARPYADVERFHRTADRLIAGLVSTTTPS